MPSRRQDDRPPANTNSANPTDASSPRAGDRIAKLLARAGIASRREIERMIAEGRVALNGTVLDTPATVLRSLSGVTVDGNPVAAPAPARLFLYHKPPGLLVTERDPRGRPTIYDRLPSDLPRVVPVGRLDLATEGLLLLTTDGGFKRQLELPTTGVERSYRARAYGNVTQAQLEDLMDGIEVEGVRYGSIDANIERRTGANVWIELTLAEGKNREVRRVLEHLGLQVSRLIRTRYGPFVLGDLPAGEVGEVKQHDLVAFRRTLKGGSPDEPIGLPAAPSPSANAPRAGFRTPASTDRSARTRRAPSASAPAERQDRGRPAETAGGSSRSKGTGSARPTTKPGKLSSRAPAQPGRSVAERPTRPAAGDGGDRNARPHRPAKPGTASPRAPQQPNRSRGAPADHAPAERPSRGASPQARPAGTRPSRPGARPPRSGSPAPTRGAPPRGKR